MPLSQLDTPYEVLDIPVDEFLIGMAGYGTPKEIQLVGAFAADPHDPTVRTAHRDVNLPPHRDGIFTQAIADMQGGNYVEAPGVDIVGMYCLRDNTIHGGRVPCYTYFCTDEQGNDIIGEVDLHAGQAVVWRNTLFHGRRGAVGNRLLIRFWVTQLTV